MSAKSEPNSTSVNLFKLTTLEQRGRWERGDRVLVETYLKRFPSLAEDSEQLLDLIYAEICLRQEHGEAIQVDEYCRRFPALAPSIRDLMEVHRAIESAASEDLDPNKTLVEPITISEVPQPSPMEDTATAAAAPPATGETTPPYQPGDRLAEPASGGPVPQTGSSLVLAGDLGDYEILETIAQGGMGVVYKARQRGLERVVALKMIRSGQFASQREVKRFMAEARLTARLRHPNIVAIHEVGEVGGHRFFSMDYVEGETLAQVIRAQSLPPVRAVRYMAAIARAVEYANKEGVLHRDLKPSNILIDGSDQPQVTDFGLATLADAESSLESGSMIVGTPSYMPPEQIQREIADVGPASDVYSLGAVLYEMLAGRPPFRAASPMDTMMQVLRAEPASPRLLNPAIDRDLETILLKCLEKQPGRRYPNSGALAVDLERYLRHEPILARPLPWYSRLWRACKREPMTASLAGVLMALALVLAVMGPLMARRERHLRTTADEQRALALRELEVSNAHRLAAEARMAAAESPPRSLLLAVEAVEAMRRRAESPLPVAEQTLRDLLAQFGGPVVAGFRGRVQWMQLSPDLHWLAVTADADNRVRLWDVTKNPTLQEPRVLEAHRNQVSAMTFSPDGAWLATADWDGKVLLWRPADPAASPLLLPGHTNAIHALSISKDSRWLVSAGADGRARVWDLRAANPEQSFRQLARRSAVVKKALFSGNGRWLMAAGDDGGAWLWPVRAEGPVDPPLVLAEPSGGSFDVLMKEGSRRVAVVRSDDLDGETHGGAMRLWDLDAADPSNAWIELPLAADAAAAADLSIDGHWAASTNADGTVTLWDLTASKPAASPSVLVKHEGGVGTLRFSPDGRWLVTIEAYAQESSRLPRVRLWDLTAGAKSRPRMLEGHSRTVWHAEFDPSGHWLITASADSRVCLWNLRGEDPSMSPVPLAGHEEAIRSLLVSRDGHRLLTAGADGTLRWWDLRSPSPTAPVLRPSARPLRAATCCRNGRWLLALDDASRGWLWDRDLPEWAETEPRLLSTPALTAAAFCPKGTRLAGCTGLGTIAVWTLPSDGPPQVLSGHEGPIHDADIGPDGHWLATAGEDGSVRLWNLDRLATPPQVLVGHTGPVVTVQFSPDGAQLASGDSNGAIRLWRIDARETAVQSVLDQHTGAVLAVRYSSDNRWMISGGLDGSAQLRPLKEGVPGEPISLHREKDLSGFALDPKAHWLATSDCRGTVFLWDLHASDPSRDPIVLPGQRGARSVLAISPDGQWLIAGGDAGNVQLWDLQNPLAGSVLLRRQSGIASLLFSHDSQWAIAAGSDGGLYLWNLSLDDLCRQAGLVAGRNFTRDEWRELFPRQQYRKTFDNLPDPPEEEQESTF